jgi:hypothetical protein
MSESKFFKVVMEDGERHRQRKNLLTLLEIRFGTNLGEYQSALEGIDDLARLEQLFRLAATCSSPNAFQAALPVEGSPPRPRRRR